MNADIAREIVKNYPIKVLTAVLERVTQEAQAGRSEANVFMPDHGNYLVSRLTERGFKAKMAGEWLEVSW